MLAAQPGQFGPLRPEAALEAGAELAGLLQVDLQLGDPLLGAPLVAGAGDGDAVDLPLGLAGGPGRPEDAGHGGGQTDRDEHTEAGGILDQPGGDGAGECHAEDRRRGKEPAQR
ncbi:hypothetical protein ACFW9F_02695 [Streptomyces sp. NPDC059506]|uniref:hypothetical protein n=1 Tax=Streptomyces sp. NPDC059506 TaxID=3347751 RepID=UPI00369CD671